MSTAPWTDFVEEVGPWIRSRDSSKIQAPLASAETPGDRFWQLAMVIMWLGDEAMICDTTLIVYRNLIVSF